jgi:hypothetical protein
MYQRSLLERRGHLVWRRLTRDAFVDVKEEAQEERSCNARDSRKEEDQVQAWEGNVITGEAAKMSTHKHKKHI